MRASKQLASRGFTLIEMMIVVVVIAILAAIAIPSYTEYVRRARLADAQKALAGTSTNLEQIFADRRLYPTTATFTPLTAGDVAVTYTPSADRRSYMLSGDGAGNMAGYYLAQNSADLRCKCENCGSNPMTALSSTATTCPAGAVPW